MGDAAGRGDGGDRPVWYAAFGSNLLRARFLTYLRGGPVPHSTGRVQVGARDRRLPSAVHTTEIDHRLYFAGASPGWGGGGVAFVAHQPGGDRPARCRVWRITFGQFEDVFAQENGRTEAVPLDLDAIVADGGHDLLATRFGRVAPLGVGPDGAPLLTVTAPSHADLPARPADGSYLRVVGRGLMEAFGMTPDDAAAYLASADGNAGHVDPTALARELASLAPDGD